MSDEVFLYDVIRILGKENFEKYEKYIMEIAIYKRSLFLKIILLGNTIHHSIQLTDAVFELANSTPVEVNTIINFISKVQPLVK